MHGSINFNDEISQDFAALRAGGGHFVAEMFFGHHREGILVPVPASSRGGINSSRTERAMLGFQTTHSWTSINISVANQIAAS